MKIAIPTLGEPSPSPGMRSSMRRGSCLKSAARDLRAACGEVLLNNGVLWAAASTFWLSAAMSAGTAAAVNRVGDRWMARLDKQRSQEERRILLMFRYGRTARADAAASNEYPR